MEICKKYLKPAIILAGVAAVAGLAVAFFMQEDDEAHIKKNEKDSANVKQGDKNEESKEGANQQLNTKELDKINQVEKFSNDGFLKKEIIFAILGQAMDKASINFAEITKENRKRRRKYLEENNLDQYVQMIIDYFQSLQQIMKQSQKDICKYLNLSEDTIEKSMENFAKNATQEDMVKMQNFQIKLQESLESEQDADLQSYKESMEFRVQVLVDQKDLLQDIMKKTIITGSTQLESQEELPALINASIGIIISDLVFQKFKLEDEDFHKVITAGGPQLEGNPEIAKLNQDLQAGLMQLLQNIFQGMPGGM